MSPTRFLCATQQAICWQLTVIFCYINSIKYSCKYTPYTFYYILKNSIRVYYNLLKTSTYELEENNACKGHFVSWSSACSILISLVLCVAVSVNDLSTTTSKAILPSTAELNHTHHHTQNNHLLHQMVGCCLSCTHDLHWCESNLIAVSPIPKTNWWKSHYWVDD